MAKLPSLLPQLLLLSEPAGLLLWYWLKRNRPDASAVSTKGLPGASVYSATKAGGRIYLQLWHCGRVSHSSFLGGEIPVSSSPLAIPGQLYTPLGMKTYETPKALTIEEVKTST